VSPRALERQLTSVLRRGYAPVGAADAVHGEGRLLHVTFDDGFLSVANALPVLLRLGVPSTVFVCSAYADDEGRTFDKVPGSTSEVDPQELRTATWHDLRELARSGVEIGSHTHRHPHLTSLSDRELAYELSGSRARIEAALGRPCRFLAYPYGDSDARVEAAAGVAGYEAAFRASGPEARLDPLAYPRTSVSGRDTPLRLWLRSSRLAGSGRLARARRRLVRLAS
jgi:peptidoglycan/xylan/chitin deacetylase (PgdA/CDA1 family)